MGLRTIVGFAHLGLNLLFTAAGGPALARGRGSGTSGTSAGITTGASVTCKILYWSRAYLNVTVGWDPLGLNGAFNFVDLHSDFSSFLVLECSGKISSGFKISLVDWRPVRRQTAWSINVNKRWNKNNSLDICGKFWTRKKLKASSFCNWL